MPDSSIDLTVTSPPYDGIRDYVGNPSFDLHTLGSELYRVCKPGAICAVVIQDSTKSYAKTLTSFRLAVDWCENLGWRLFECCIYRRWGRPGAWWRTRFKVDHEYIMLFLKGDKTKAFHKELLYVPTKHAGKVVAARDRLTDGSLRQQTPKATKDMMCRGTVWNYAASNTEGNKLKLQHPATFPSALAEDLILCFSDVGDTVLDPFSGSGTTCAMAKKNGRQYVGIDISDRYCEIARKIVSGIQ